MPKWLGPFKTDWVPYLLFHDIGTRSCVLRTTTVFVENIEVLELFHFFGRFFIKLLEFSATLRFNGTQCGPLDYIPVFFCPF